MGILCGKLISALFCPRSTIKKLSWKVNRTLLLLQLVDAVEQGRGCRRAVGPEVASATIEGRGLLAGASAPHGMQFIDPGARHPLPGAAVAMDAMAPPSAGIPS
jgi:hypothetical protein